MMRWLDDGSFYPFEQIRTFCADGSDFDIQEVAEALELNSLQKQLLQHLLCHIDMRIWFHADDKQDEVPTLELNVFWDGNFAASVDLDRLLEGTFYGDGSSAIEPEQEIVALENLRRIVDAAIEARKSTAGES